MALKTYTFQALLNLIGHIYMARIFARLTLLLIGTDAIKLCILNSVWGANEEARIALGGPRGDLLLIRRRVLAQSKIVINTRGQLNVHCVGPYYSNCIIIFSMCFACTRYSLVLILHISLYLEIKGTIFFGLEDFFCGCFMYKLV